jgi:hypothetical protein
VRYDHLQKKIDGWMKGSTRALHHNIQLLRESLQRWGREKVHLGTLEEWKRQASHTWLSGVVKNTCLWLDSSDFHLEGKSTTSQKAPSWSYKLNSSSQHFMALQDAHGKIHALWGGYSPKVYNGDFLKSHKDWLDEYLAGATVITDTHFAWGKTLEKVKFITPIPHPPSLSASMVGTRMHNA